MPPVSPYLTRRLRSLQEVLVESGEALPRKSRREETAEVVRDARSDVGTEPDRRAEVAAAERRGG